MEPCPPRVSANQAPLRSFFRSFSCSFVRSTISWICLGNLERIEFLKGDSARSSKVSLLGGEIDQASKNDQNPEYFQLPSRRFSFPGFLVFRADRNSISGCALLIS
ncbi:hypothetical protein PUN28_010756 [Cardiocondyla obscurior]|uniref:Uncharacterized protein n=1 Tax=Cardiocondyla obscurior TaxID=286306 RepID=A0AAW2FNA3_9HYME